MKKETRRKHKRWFYIEGEGTHVYCIELNVTAGVGDSIRIEYLDQDNINGLRRQVILVPKGKKVSFNLEV